MIFSLFYSSFTMKIKIGCATSSIALNKTNHTLISYLLCHDIASNVVSHVVPKINVLTKIESFMNVRLL